MSDTKLDAVPTINPTDNITVVPSLLNSSSLLREDVMAELPFTNNAVVYRSVDAASYNSNVISFSCNLNSNDLLERHLTFNIPEIKLNMDIEAGIYNDTNAAITCAGDDPSVVLTHQPIAMRNFNNLISSVEIDFGNGFVYNINNNAALNNILSFYGDEQSVKENNVPLLFQKGLANLNSEYIPTTKPDKDIYTRFFNHELSPFNKASNGSYIKSSSGGPLTAEGLKTKVVQPNQFGGVLCTTLENNVKTSPNMSFRDVVFTLPTDLLNDNLDSDKKPIYGVNKIEIRLHLNYEHASKVLLTTGDYSVADDEFNVVITNTNDKKTYENKPLLYRIKKINRIEFLKTPKINYCVRSPPSFVVEEMNRNKNWVLPFNKYELRNHGIKTKSGLNGGDKTFTIESSEIVVNTIPKYLFVAVTKQTRLSGNTGSTGFANISKMRVRINGRETLLPSTRILYDISKNAGYAFNWNHFNYLTGSVVCIPFSELNCGGEYLMGENGNFVIGVEVDCERQDTGENYADKDTDDYILQTVTVTDANVVKKDDSISIVTGYNISADRNALKYTDLSIITRSIVYGGFFGKVWRGIKKGVSALPGIANTIGNVANTIGKYAPAVGKYSQVASNLLGSGRKSYVSGGAVYSDREQYLQ